MVVDRTMMEIEYNDYNIGQNLMQTLNSSFLGIIRF